MEDKKILKGKELGKVTGGNSVHPAVRGYRAYYRCTACYYVDPCAEFADERGDCTDDPDRVCRKCGNIGAYIDHYDPIWND